MAKNKLKLIEKVSEVTQLDGVIVDSLESNNPTKNATSIRIVKEVKDGLDTVSSRVDTIETKEVTSVKLDGANQETLSLQTVRTASPIYVRTQAVDSSGNAISIEGTAESIFLKNKTDVTDEVNLQTILTTLKTLIDSALFTVNPKEIFDELEKYI